MAQIVAAALVSHGPLVTGRPEVSKPEQRERVLSRLHPDNRAFVEYVLANIPGLTAAQNRVISRQ